MKPATIRSAPIADVLEHLRDGGIVLLAGDRLRDGDIDFVAAAEYADAHVINFMATHGRGLICLGLLPAQAQQLGLSLMNATDDRQSGRPFAVSIEAREGVDTGISAADRARTIAAATAPDASGLDIVSPGHVFPLIARTGGVLERAGAVDAAVDLARLAGLAGSAVLCSVMNDAGGMARIDSMYDFAEDHGLQIASIDALIDYRRKHDPLMRCVSDDLVSSRFGGQWRQRLYRRTTDGMHVLALDKGDPTSGGITSLHVHRLNLAIDVLGCGAQNDQSLQQVMTSTAGADAAIVMLTGLDHPAITSNSVSGSEADFDETGACMEILLDIGAGDLVPRGALSASIVNAMSGVLTSGRDR